MTALHGVPEELVPQLVGRHVHALAGVAGECQHGVEVHVQVGRPPLPRIRRGGGGSLGVGVSHPHVAQLTAELGQDLLFGKPLDDLDLSSKYNLIVLIY